MEVKSPVVTEWKPVGICDLSRGFMSVCSGDNSSLHLCNVYHILKLKIRMTTATKNRLLLRTSREYILLLPIVLLHIGHDNDSSLKLIVIKKSLFFTKKKLIRQLFHHHLRFELYLCGCYGPFRSRDKIKKH